MPKIEVEILRTVTVTREENVIAELDVPKRVLDDGDVVGWIDEIMEKNYESMSPKEKAVHAEITCAEWDVADEDESVEYNEATEID